MDDAGGHASSGDPAGGRQKPLCVPLAGWPEGEGTRLGASARLALARESLGAPGTLCQAYSDEPDVWGGGGGHRRCTGPGSLLPVLSGDIDERSLPELAVAAAHLG